MKKNKLLTIPNVLSFFRLCLIPLIVWLYCVKEKHIWAAAVVVISGITDVADGIIARKFDMVSDFGKAFDPIADKLTQIAVMICLVTRFHLLLLPLVIMIIKEIITGIMSVAAIKNTGEIAGADWHGKINTVLLYAMMTLHMVWSNIPSDVSALTVILCTAIMLVSAMLYGIRNYRAIKN